jgi:uncharacterized protein YbaP (TraB family)
LIKENLNIPGEMAEDIINQRTKETKWIKAIDDFLKKENCFIAVGLSHLMYGCGLINQLAKLGYTVTPIKVN